MRCSGSCPEARRRAGFTLLELVLALLCAGLLVAALVSIWIQVIRTGSTAATETAAHGQRQAARRQLQRLLGSARWTPSSHLPQGTLPWHGGGGSVTFWSGETAGGGAGPVRWGFQAAEGGWAGRWQDPQPEPGSAAEGTLRVEGLRDLRLECLKGDVDLTGEQLHWIGAEAWDPAQPFRPLGLRLRLTWTDDTQELLVAGP